MSDRCEPSRHLSCSLFGFCCDYCLPEEETFVVNTSTVDGDDCTYLIKSKLDLGLTDHWGKEILEWLNENGIYGCECNGSEFVTAVTSIERIDGTI